ncbi:Tn3 family transposase [Streptomyces sp. JV185]|nr:Tn3 family transposase [Streptomyces sp. JV185]MEE1767542.1 Tn3 family transposase [Streptomyces sp. JV185]
MRRSPGPARPRRSSKYYLRADTIAAANAALIDAQARVPIVQHRSKGLLASVDDLHFLVPGRTINAAPGPKYFAKRSRWRCPVLRAPPRSPWTPC